jgi:exopolysaccharide biosynthesis polyprenyl glycosylphosphotransferase
MATPDTRFNLLMEPSRARGVSLAGSKSFGRLMLILMDAAMLAAAFALAYWVRFHLRLTFSPDVEPESGFYLKLGAALIPVWLGIFSAQGLYDPESEIEGPQELSRVFHACGTSSMLLVLLSFLDTQLVIARGWLVGVWVLTILFVSGARVARRTVVRSLRKRGSLITKTLVVGSNGEAQSVAAQLAQHPESGYRVVGIVTTPQDGHASVTLGDRTLPAVGEIQDIGGIVERTGAQEVIAAASSLHRDELLGVFEQLQPMPNVRLRLSSGLYEVVTTGVQAGAAASIPLLTLRRFRLSPSEATLKTILEYGLTGLGVLFLAPVFALIALLVRLDSPGPIIFRRRVLGVGGASFDAFKFRTMYIDGDARLEAAGGLAAQLERDGKLKYDPRITRLGRFLRRFSLDELPQLLNVLRGEMSLVGPRMITASEAVKYGRHRANLLTVKPGITGLWQVSGRSDLDYEERIRLDMHYIRNYSVWLDLYILLVQTPGAVLSGRGAY